MLRYFSQRNPTVLLPMAKVRVMVRVGVRVRVSLYSEQVLSSLGTMTVFLVTLRLSAPTFRATAPDRRPFRQVPLRRLRQLGHIWSRERPSVASGGAG